MKKILILTVGIFFLYGFSVKAQGQRLLSGLYKNSTFSEMTSDLELRYGLHFFYTQELDSIIIDLGFSEITLKEFVRQISLIINNNFLIVNNTSVIATGAYLVDTELNPTFFFNQQQTNPINKQSVLNNIHEIAEKDDRQRLKNQIIEIGDVAKQNSSQSATLTGFVRDTNTGEPIIGASIFRKEPQIEGVGADQFGYFSFTLPKGKHELFITATGMKPVKRKIMLYNDGNLNVELEDDIISLKGVVVTGEYDAINNLNTGFSTISIKNIKQIPSIMGEADIMKIALTLPGVQTVGEGAAGFNVRGGSADQNLVLLNDVPIYNTSHLFGFFSVFNPDVIASANLYKSGIDANYGGRIASVFDVTLRDGNRKKFAFKGGISPITVKLIVEGPIKKDTSSYIVGIRSTYSDWVLSLLDNPDLRNSTGAFFDMVGKVNHKIDDKNSIVFSAYHSRDNFRLGADTLYKYSNSNASLQWRHTFSNRLYSLTSLSYANYNFQLSSENNPLTAFELKYQINHYSFKTEYNYFPKEKVNIKFGLSSILYKLKPGQNTPIGGVSLVKPVKLTDENGLETALYGGFEFVINYKFSVYAGLRISMFNRLGPGQVFTYRQDSPKEIEFITDTTFYSNNQISKTYINPEVRLSGRYKLREDLSLKFSYDRMSQYIHVLSNTISISPIDNWRLSGEGIKPQVGNQFSAGMYKTLYSSGLELSIEGYYKIVNNVLEYKDGAELLVNKAIETDIIGAKNQSYGVELLLKKKSGKFSGWISYTYARSLLKTISPYPVEQINMGESYPSNYDIPHTAILVSNFKINRRVNISLNLRYSTGRPTTFPLVKYNFKNQPFLLYTARNQVRIPDYFRADVAINLDGNHKVNKKIHSSWSFSIYNLTGRSNAYSVFFGIDNEQIKGYMVTIFNQAIPTLTYLFQLR